MKKVNLNGVFKYSKVVLKMTFLLLQLTFKFISILLILISSGDDGAVAARANNSRVGGGVPEAGGDARAHDRDSSPLKKNINIKLPKVEMSEHEL